MDDPNRLALELDSEELALLAAIAEQEDQTVSEVAADAVRARLAVHKSYVEAVKRGLADVAAGRLIDHDALLAHRAEQRRRYLADGPG